MNVLGLDVGGANLKFCNGDGKSVSMVFPMWKDYGELAATLARIAEQEFSSPAPELIALTMTAELADCFQTKAKGVAYVIRAVQNAFPETLVRTWMTTGEFAAPHHALEFPELVSSANWHASATWVGRASPEGSMILLDIGSTTTDVIPIQDGIPTPVGLNDRERLKSRELVYAAAGRTPICALVQEFMLGEEIFPLASELFATSVDALVVNKDFPPDETFTATADNRPLTMHNCEARLARMMCCDLTQVPKGAVQQIAYQAAEALKFMISGAVTRVMHTLPESPTLVLAGSGSGLGKAIVSRMGHQSFRSIMFIDGMFRQDVSHCVPAFSVARLAVDHCRDDLLPISGVAV